MFNSLLGLRREIDRLFESTFGRGLAGQSEWSPAVDIRETDLELTFQVEVPGIKLEDVEVTAEDGMLTIHGQRKDRQIEGDEVRYHLVERTYGSFVRRFQLPPGVDTDKIEADIELGMLQIHIKKGALAQPKTIEIKVGGIAGRRLEKALSQDRQNSRKLPK